jgi:hypothetical protein
MAQSEVFETWRKREVARRLGDLDEIERRVESKLANVRVEGIVDGRWAEL